MIFKKRICPRWIEKTLLLEYGEAIRNVERLRHEVNVNYMVNDCKKPDVKLLRRYSYAVGEAAAIEVIMDKLFIEYDDGGRLKEFYL